MVGAQRFAMTKDVLVLHCPQAILALAPVLQAVAARCGQPGAMHWLPYFLAPQSLKHRVPRLVLLLRPEENAGTTLRASDVEAAALFYEYTLYGVPTGVVSSGDAVGFNTVIAPAGQRAWVAACAATALVDRGAAVVLATYDAARESLPLPHLNRTGKLRWQTRTREVPRMLHLGSTLADTLATMGKSTRFNLRYYRRRLEKGVACEFVAEAAPLLHGEDLDSLNANSLNPVDPEEFRRRVAAASDLSGSFLCGLRLASGQWLSLAGGWRDGRTAVLYWQMNTSGWEKHSIGTVMRSYLLEAEIARGTEDLLVYGGTPHPMRHAFREDTIADLMVERRGWQTRLIRTAAYAMKVTGTPVHESFIVNLLGSRDIGSPMFGYPARLPAVLARGLRRGSAARGFQPAAESVPSR